MILKKIIRTLTFSTVLTFTAMPAAAQDLLARQAPVDHKAKIVETMAFKEIVQKENLENPSSDLYEEWENRRTHATYPLPETYKIDLRGFHMPTPSRVITSNFGRRWGRQHKGLDIKVYIGDTIRAAFSGKVRVVRYEGRGYGNYVVIRHNNGLETVYGHMSKQLVHENQIVRAGQPIGLGGNTGRSTGSHLHFETRLCGVALNPALMFDFRNQDVTGDFYTFRKSTNEYESNQATLLRGKNDTHGYTKEDVQGPVAARGEELSATRDNEIRWHHVVSGEDLESIAEQHGITVEQLCKLNNIGRFTQVSRGQLLRY